MNKTLYFVRHGQTEWNAIRRMQGRWNSDLNDVGRRQAHAGGRLLGSLPVDTLFASPLDRTRQTATIIGDYVAAPIHYDERIMEWDCGDWSGEQRDAIENRWPEQWRAFQADRYGYRGPGCENYPDMIERTRPFLDELLAMNERHIAIVSHGIIGRVMVSVLLGHDPATMLAYSQPNEVIYRVTLAGTDATVHHYDDGRGPVPGLWQSNW